ncbi:rho GTPase activating protein at 71E isoform X4 [Haematobia irritans]|uniref:rho GTPase activating protein at 71E isoform X4 n=1 Tax=Haematobia irritans TaxID=7368 RepID=UPI003F507A47
MSSWAERVHRRAADFSSVVTSCGHPGSSAPTYPYRLEKVKFGVPLDEVCKNDNIPGPLLVLILKLNKESPNRRDVFRAPGHQGAMKKLIHFLQAGRLVNVDNYSVYTIASVLKKFLRKVPHGIFGRSGENELFAIIELNNEAEQNERLHKLFTSLPKYTQHLLVLLFGTFRVIASNADHAGTGMTSEALGVSVAPSFFQSCVSDGKTARMEDVLKFKVATKIMKYIIDKFATHDLFGRDNYEYYARVTGRILKVQDEWICSFQYPPPPRGKLAQQKYALQHSLEAEKTWLQCQCERWGLRDADLENNLMQNLKKLLDGEAPTDIVSSDDEEEYLEYIYKPRKYFLTGLCNLCKIDLCKRPSIECAKCHNSYYCSVGHMKNDVEHRPLCSALQQVAANGGPIFDKCSDMNPDQFRSYRIVTIRNVSSILQRPLTATEQEVILFPRLCMNAKCRKFEFKSLQDCTDCGMVSYCSDSHLSAEHKKWCGFYHLFKELIIFQEKFGRLDPGLPTKILKETPEACANTKEVFSKLSIEIPDNCCEYAALSQISTGPLTSWYALKSCQQLDKHENLTIHLIGAEIEFEVDVLNKWELFFLHITPTVKNLNVVFVGPELNPNNISFDQLKKTKCCKVCRKHERTVQYFFEPHMYHDYCKRKNFLKPNLICFFNAGLYRSTGYKMEDSWPETIKAASKLQVPVVVTAYTEYEMPLDMERFVEECGRELKIVQAPQENPFSSVKPERNFISDDEAPLMFKNYFYFVVE